MISAACWPGCRRRARALLVALFDGDPFDPDPAGARRAGRGGRARPRRAPPLALWPRDGDHAAMAAATTGASPGCSAPCVLTLVQAPEAAAPRGLRRAPCGGG